MWFPYGLAIWKLRASVLLRMQRRTFRIGKFSARLTCLCVHAKRRTARCFENTDTVRPWSRTTVREYVEDIRVCAHTKPVELDRVRDPENDVVELK